MTGMEYETYSAEGTADVQDSPPAITLDFLPELPKGMRWGLYVNKSEPNLLLLLQVQKEGFWGTSWKDVQVWRAYPSELGDVGGIVKFLRKLAQGDQATQASLRALAKRVLESWRDAQDFDRFAGMLRGE